MSGIIIAVLFGWAGGYRFYKGQKGLGILYLLTVGLCGIGWIADIAISIADYSKQSKSSLPSTFDFYMPGTYYHTKEIASVGSPKKTFYLSDEEILKKDLKRRIYEYSFNPMPVRFQEEPTNEHDPNAVAIYAGDIKLGYVPADMCIDMKKLIKGNKIASAMCSISGGDYKYIENGRVYTSKSDYDAKVTVNCI